MKIKEKQPLFSCDISCDIYPEKGVQNAENGIRKEVP
nr:MAG TPA: hypothetical protein [Caudoviricetes sp.]